jgi:putative transposase
MQAWLTPSPQANSLTTICVGTVPLPSSRFVWHTRHRTTPPTPKPCKRHWFPAEIISDRLWLSFRVCLGPRDVEELLFEHGSRRPTKPSASGIAHSANHMPRPDDKWYLGEVFLTIDGAHHYLGRVVDREDHRLPILVQRRRHKQAAKQFFHKLLKGSTYVPRVRVTDQLKSYEAAKRELLPTV